MTTTKKVLVIGLTLALTALAGDNKVIVADEKAALKVENAALKMQLLDTQARIAREGVARQMDGAYEELYRAAGLKMEEYEYDPKSRTFSPRRKPEQKK